MRCSGPQTTAKGVVLGNVALGAYLCHCDDGWAGANCTSTINECTNWDQDYITIPDLAKRFGSKPGNNREVNPCCGQITVGRSDT